MEALPLSEQFKCFGAASVPADRACEILQENLRQYGPTVRTQLYSVAEARNFLMPLKSFPTRYVVFGYKGWSLVLSDMRNENSLVDVLLLSRISRCDAISVRVQETRRDFAVFRAGKQVREVESLLDEGIDLKVWRFRQEGDLQPFEEASQYRAANKAARLLPEAVRRYFTAFTGLEFPSWSENVFEQAIGLERSTNEAVVPIRLFETVDDMKHSSTLGGQPKLTTLRFMVPMRVRKTSRLSRNTLRFVGREAMGSRLIRCNVLKGLLQTCVPLFAITNCSTRQKAGAGARSLGD